ncbi:MAG TPA: RNB domain-containing ribonuclease [Thermoanaerobaculia bacterium]|jgi:exoribonuclease-2|nr:RNB domain-containing ribonuclease [Thermoanaerobaculia bacterium]
MKPRPDHQRSDLEVIARRVMREHGLWPEFSPAAVRQVEAMRGPAPPAGKDLRDLTALPWCSIDNDDSRDLDQLSVAAEPPAGGRADGDASRILVAIADVDALVTKGSPVDDHARNNTTSVYTGAAIFPMLPERLSTDLTSLNLAEVRVALVVDMVVGGDGKLRGSSLYRAAVTNHAKLAYDSVAAWLDGGGPLPPGVAAVPGLDDNLRRQDRMAQAMRRERHEHGALVLQTIEARPVFDGETIRDLHEEVPNRAKELIEDFMVAANGVTARFLAAQKYPSLRRVVRSPERWQRIVKVAAEHGAVLPAEPDAKALQQFLLAERQRDAVRFPDLSLVIVKLMGAGEYAVEAPGRDTSGHFGLAVHDYTHSTAPNRRFPDLITHRVLKAALAGAPPPYPLAELDELALHCTQREDAANKVERQVRKSAAALLLEDRLGERFDAVVTGASPKGTFVRVLHPPVEGKVVRGFDGLEVGDPVRVKLTATDVERGFIDFVRQTEGRRRRGRGPTG